MLRRASSAVGIAGACGALGLATTVLVAWGLAAWLPVRGLTRRFDLVFGARGTAHAVRVYEFERAGMLRRCWRLETAGQTLAIPVAAIEHVSAVTGVSNERVGARGWGGLGDALANDADAVPQAIETAYGWPRPALWWRAPSGVLPRTFDGVESGIPLSATGAKSVGLRSLPLMPAPEGVLVDTAAFGSAWGAVLAGAWIARRARRLRRGWCPACAYDLGELTGGCPECGWGRAQRP